MDLTAGLTGDRTAVVTRDRTVTAAELAGRAGKLADPLDEVLPTGAPVAVWVAAPDTLAAGVLGVLRTRRPALLVPPETTAARVVGLTDLERSAAVLGDDDLVRGLPGGSVRRLGHGLALWTGATSGPTAHRAASAAVHILTSGTDGLPKAVVRSAASLVGEADAVGARLGVKPGTTVLCTAPVTSSYGFTLGLVLPLLRGATAAVLQPRLPASLDRVLHDVGPDVVVAVPGQYAGWAALRRTPAGPLPRVWVSSGAPLPGAVRVRFEAAWSARLAEQYGMTECGAVSVDLDGETLGRPYPGVVVSVDDDGEVFVRTPYGASGYVGGSGCDAARFTAAGFRTGDRGRLDDEGRLHLVGRRAQQVNVRGRQVDPVEVERALWSVEGVLDVAVVGVDRAGGDQWLAAYVVAEDVDDAALHARLTGLESHKRPQRVVRLPALPKTANGKTDRAALGALAADAQPEPSRA